MKPAMNIFRVSIMQSSFGPLDVELSDLGSSIVPRFMSEWSGVKLVSMQSPLRHDLIHDRDESVIVVTLQKMHQLVHDYVLQALGRFLR